MSFYELPADKNNHLIVKDFQAPSKIAHFHNAIEILYLKKGELDAVINGTRHRVKAGQAVFSGSFDVHYYELINEEPVESTVLVISQDYLKEYNDFLAGKTLNVILSIRQEIADFILAWQKVYKQESILMLTSKILYLLAKLIEDNLAEKTSAPKNEFVTNIFKYIHDNYKEDISVNEIANKFGYSRGYVSTMFTTYTGEGFNSYVNRLRVYSAKEEIDKKDGRRILDIALENGFDSANTFYRAYKKQFGEPPVKKLR
ncbi:MAG: helix-turn-helix domain-containing protein [Clostridia bacterium]|nr:helix-turn-helix domain-containing protein [Clostridia bacterium]